eukprot:CAMPEP_0197534244 /NCGR_PEP_ID=MMETSP1318-20131121/46465_1 /TAXON_ID=552666 /ORGANISM="Partenskyella glossopodia, Strain RCC365" /LENGTH=867 /DNA_ID=CAMNT_0043091437 /DNA_START=51 /DNA_END=2654 /DNA_ORIENTATION=-
MATPYEVCLCLLVQDYVAKRHYDQDPSCMPESGYDEYCYRVSLFLIGEMKECDSIYEKKLSELNKDLTRAGIPLAFSTLKERLDSILSPDCLFDIFQELEDLLWAGDDQDDLGHVEGSSVFGIFIRKVVICYKNMMFDGLSNLYERIKAYTDQDVSFPVSKERMEQYSSKKAQALERQMGGGMSCAEAEAEIAHLLSLNPGLHQAHFLRYLNYAQHKEYAKALDCLHRYFDYYGSNVLNQELQNDHDNNQPQPNNPLQYAVLNLALLHTGFHHYTQAAQALLEAIRMAQLDNDHTCLVHALVLFADICHASGATQYSLQLIRQCVEAQAFAAVRVDEVKKEIKNRGNGDIKDHEREILQKAQAVPAIEAQAYLKLAMYVLQQAPKAGKWRKTWAGLQQARGGGSSIGNSGGLISGPGEASVEYAEQQSRLGLAMQALDYASKSSAIWTSQNTADQLGMPLLTRSRIWEVVGHRQLSRLYSRMYLSFFRDDDHHDNNNNKDNDHGQYDNRENKSSSSNACLSALAHSNLASLEENPAKRASSLSSSSSYSSGLGAGATTDRLLLDSDSDSVERNRNKNKNKNKKSDKLVASKNNQQQHQKTARRRGEGGPSLKYPWYGYSGFHERRLQLMLEGLLVQGKWQQSREVMDELACFTPRLEEDATRHVEVRILEARLMAQQHGSSKEQAWRCLVQLLEVADVRCDQLLSTKVLVALVELHIDSGDAISSVPYLLRLLEISGELQLTSVKLKVNILVAKLQLSLGQARSARDLLMSSVPYTLGNCSREVRGEVLVSLADCDVVDETAEASKLRFSLQNLKKVEEESQDCGNWRQLQRVYYLAARLYDRLGEYRNRNFASKKFLEMSELIDAD